MSERWDPVWADARRKLEQAKAYWLSTVREDGRPHVTTVAALWFGDEGDVLAYRLKTTKAFGFAKSPFSQTRWRFDS
jgi:pyridoxine/pyridoxamine 5'-phosphate oxidase